MNQGISRMMGQFEKNIYEPNELVRADAIIDNKDCQIAVTGVRLAIEQELKLVCGGHTYQEMLTLASKTEPGIPALNKENVHRHIEVNLGSIRVAPIPSRTTKKGVTKPYQPEDTFMMSQIQAAAHGGLIKNEYFVAIRTDYDGCTCCDSTPLARTPLQIVPIPNPACWFQPPQGFAPQVQPMVMVPVILTAGYVPFMPPPMPMNPGMT